MFAKADCEQPLLPFSEECGIQVEKVGAVPAVNTFPFSYNMAPFDNFRGNTIFFVDQKEGIIYSHTGGSKKSAVTKVWDMSEDDIPSGLTLDWEFTASSAATYRVKSMSQGKGSDIIVVLTSSTLPTGWTEADATLPAAGAIPKYACRGTEGQELEYVEDIYRVGTLPDCSPFGGTSLTGYDSFYKMKLVNGKLTNPRPFFVSETQIVPGHLGGGILFLPDRKLLWATGDCTVFGLDGSYPPQLEDESCGKILMIDPEKKGSYKVAAMGVRNSQQMRLFEPESDRRRELESEDIQSGRRALKGAKKSKKTTPPKQKKNYHISFMDIGGVTAEEVNAFPFSALRSETPLNFGWGRSLKDGKAREGTFYVNHGKAFVLGGEPSCNSDAPAQEDGFVQPWVQFGRNGFDFFFGISSMAIPSKGMLKLIWSEFNTGKLLGTGGGFVEGAPPAEAFKLKIFDESGAELDGLNPLVAEELGDDSGVPRGDARLFHFPDGELGFLMERTGAFYKVTEIPL